MIHEEWTLEDGRTFQARGLPSVVLHHDGYVVMEGAWGKEKEERNHALLEEKLAEDPENVITLMQCIESSNSENREDYVRKAMAAARAREEYNRCPRDGGLVQ